jgi:hypothetical protein
MRIIWVWLEGFLYPLMPPASLMQFREELPAIEIPKLLILHIWEVFFVFC